MARRLARYVEANGHRFPAGNGSGPVAGEQAETIAELRARAELAEARLDDLKAALADMQQRDKWETVATRLSLPAPKPDEKPSPADQPSRLRRAWAWMRATG
jgi:hypothetical protein